MLMEVTLMDWVELESRQEVVHYFLVVSLPAGKVGNLDLVVTLAGHDRLELALKEGFHATDNGIKSVQRGSGLDLTIAVSMAEAVAACCVRV